MTQQFAARRHRQVLDWPVVAGGDEIVGETPRLRLRRLRPSDIDAVAAMVADPEQIGLSRLVAIIHPDNHASRRVARTLGMAEERSLVREGEPTVVYCISA